MPNGDYKLPKLSKGEFEQALLIYLEGLEEKLEQNPEWKEGWVGQKWADFAEVMPTDIRFARTRSKEFTDKLYNYYMDLAESQGVGEWLPDYQLIIQTGAPHRVKFELGTQYEEKLKGWQTDVTKTAQDLWENKLAKAKFEATERERALSAEQWERKFEWQKEQADRDWRTGQTRIGMEMAQGWNEQRRLDIAHRANLMAFETQRLGMWQGREGEAENQKLAEQFERVRREMLSSTAPGDWIRREKARMAENPYAPKVSMQEEIGLAETERKDIQTARHEAYEELKEARQEFKDVSMRVGDTLGPIEPWALTSAQNKVEAAKFRYDELTGRQHGVATWISQAKGTEQFQVEAEWAKPRGTAEQGYEVGMPDGGQRREPVIPAGLQQHFGVQRFGQTIETPSPQQWGRAPVSARQEFLGWAEGRGQSPEDIMQRMESMKPRPLRLGRTWGAARQV